MKRWIELTWRLFWARDKAAKTKVRRSVSQKYAKRRKKSGQYPPRRLPGPPTT